MAARLSPANSQDPPPALVRRRARVATTATNTIRIPHDRFRDDTQVWYQAGLEVPGNQVKYLIDGPEAFSEMVAAIRTATRPGHFVYMVNWFCDVDFELLRNDEPGVNLRQLLTQASANGVKIRALFWKPQFGTQNRDAWLFLNSREMRLTVNGPQEFPVEHPLRDAAAISDERGSEHIPIPIFGILPWQIGSQHQKFLCVLGEQGLVCFCGGIDFNPDRVDRQRGEGSGGSSGTKGSPLHDVHCRMIGPAALGLVRLFQQRWDSHRSASRINERLGPLIIPGAQPNAGEHKVQIARTLGRGYYSFAPDGERSAADMLDRAIRNARRFIYTEDQYFVGNPRLLAALSAALGRIEHLTVVLTHFRISDMPEVQFHRRLFIERLKRAGGNRVRIFSIKPPRVSENDFNDGRVGHTYVHAKVWIIDDEFASIGTLNSSRRSWSHDNEVTAGIYETSTDQVLHYRLAHWLRIMLWNEHLNLPHGPAELADGVAGAVHWLRLPPGALVRPYDENEDAGGVNEFSALWDVTDPE